MPSIGSLIRARWSHLLHGFPGLHSALSLESVVDEVILVIGPLTVSMLGTYINPSAGLLMALLCALVGTGGLPPSRAPSHPRGAVISPPTAPCCRHSGFLPLIPTFIAVYTAGTALLVVKFHPRPDTEDSCREGDGLTVAGAGFVWGYAA
jgi:hypothetical protein